MTRAVVVMLAIAAPLFSTPLLLVVPNAQTNTVGNSTDFVAGAGSFHSQQIFGSSQFSSVPGDLLITQLALRTVPGTGAAALNFSSASLSLSTTQYFPNTSGPVLTDTFATNLGGDNTLVYSGPLSLSTPGCAGPSVCPFDMIILLNTPFLYHRTQGRLLMDIQGTVTDGMGVFDQQSFFFPPGGFVASVDGLLGDSTGTFRSEGDIFQIGYTLLPTPEPGSSALVIVGLGTLGLVMRRRRSR